MRQSNLAAKAGSALKKTAKDNLSANSRELNIESLHNRDAGKVPLRITKSLVILVSKEKATPEYAEEYRTKMENNQNRW